MTIQELKGMSMTDLLIYISGVTAKMIREILKELNIKSLYKYKKKQLVEMLVENISYEQMSFDSCIETETEIKVKSEVKTEKFINSELEEEINKLNDKQKSNLKFEIKKFIAGTKLTEEDVAIMVEVNNIFIRGMEMTTLEGKRFLRSLYKKVHPDVISRTLFDYMGNELFEEVKRQEERLKKSFKRNDEKQMEQTMKVNKYSTTEEMPF